MTATRYRRTNAELWLLDSDLQAVLQANQPCTLRQIFYLATVRGLVPKTEYGYDLVGRRMIKLREDGNVPFEWLVDNTRWMRKPSTYTGLKDLLEQTAQIYRRALWAKADAYCEIWLEKDALAGVVYPVIDRYDVPLMVSRGYSSLSFIYSAAQAILFAERPAFIYYFGDRDPSGVDIDRSIELKLRQYAPMADITFQRVAVLPEQITAWNLPTRPSKTSDKRTKNFEGDSVELDAIPPDVLRGLVQACIERHVDQDQLERLAEIEAGERATLEQWAARWPDGA